ncbi:GspH/FimT family pseudopilin [Endozoicomonas gorgoniicola]|uniref:Type II secretion system protein H n=1 Tax=Endozoicomonas gorgoniicola TaxID=1234144 RepID=A0ABT3MXX2_9GAMM|nr:GspH/FimT family pseudopilin [Endozoicomonas gorgoniicola]MCW7554231.1 GspH/FimT family pseudopilin [Endozoicomonas gorgoniicola]
MTEMKRESSGFSLIEALVTVAVIAIAAGIGIPNFNHSIANGRLNESANAFMGAINYARAEAFTRKQTVHLCSADSKEAACNKNGLLSAGAAVINGSNVLLRIPAARQGIEIRPKGISIDFNNRGQLVAGSVTLSFCDQRGPASALALSINGSGQVSKGGLVACN